MALKELPIVPSAEGGTMANAPVGNMWRVKRPVISQSCNTCLMCTLFCPDGALTYANERLSFALCFCKGCGICAAECGQKAITMSPEFEEAERS